MGVAYVGFLASILGREAGGRKSYFSAEECEPTRPQTPVVVSMTVFVVQDFSCSKYNNFTLFQNTRIVQSLVLYYFSLSSLYDMLIPTCSNKVTNSRCGET